MRFALLVGAAAFVAGAIRSAALLGFDVPKEAFVTTGTAIGLRRIPERVFRVTVSLLVLGLGVAVLAGLGR